MDFHTRLERAVERGQQTKDARAQEERARTLSQDELKTIHSQTRLELADHIETCLKSLAEQFPGFEYHSILNEHGWGARVSRDDVALRSAAGSDTQYSRLDVLVRPFSDAHIVELVGKATIRNKEAFNRTNYQLLSQVDAESFRNMIDLWVLEYAERFAATL
jgi:hypothetical protein